LLVDENAPDEQRLLSSLLSRYEPASRPTQNASDVVSVQFGLTLAQISDMVCSYNMKFTHCPSFFLFCLILKLIMFKNRTLYCILSVVKGEQKVALDSFVNLSIN